MTDHWDDWPDDGVDDQDTADLGGPDWTGEGAPVGDYPVEGFGAADDPVEVEGFGAVDADDGGPSGQTPGPIGYGDVTVADEAYPRQPPPAPGEPGLGPEVGALADPPVGADPDAVRYGDDTWPGLDLPDPVEFGAVPEPVDGFPWADPTVLGDPAGDTEPSGPAGSGWWAGPPGTPAPGDLAAYAGEDLPAGVDPWAALAASEDPATSTLARFWAPDRP